MEVEVYWGSSPPCLFVDTGKRMQQMVSRANVPRTMMSATRLTEPEKKELEWESRWEQRKLESQQFEARWEKMMQQLRNMIFPKPIGEVAVADKESNFASLVEEVDLQYEARRQQSEARFHERMADTDPQTFIPLPQVEGQGFVSLESHDGEWNVQRSTAATDEHSDSHESHEKEGEPIGKLFMSCNSIDHDPLEIAVTPLQKTKKMELSMPLPHKWKSTEVSSIDSKSHVLSFSHNSAYYSVRNSARELDLSKIVDDGLVEQLSGVVEEESMMLGKDAIGNFEEFGKYSNFSLQFCLDAKAGGGKINHGQVKKGMELEQNQLQRTERLSHARQNAPVRELTVVLPISACYSLSLSWLLNWFPRPKVKMKTKEVELGDLIATPTQEFGEGIQLMDDASKLITRAVVKVPAYLNDSQRIATEDVSSLSYGFERKTFTAKDVQVPEQDVKDNRDILILEIGILVGKKYGGKREEDPLLGDMSFDRCFCIDEGIEQLEQLGSLCNHYVCQGRFYIGGGLEQVEKWETLFVKVDHLFCYNFQPKPLWILVRIRFWTKTGPWLQSSLIRTFHLGCLHFALFLLTMTCFLPSLRTRKLIGGSIDTITIAWLMGGDERERAMDRSDQRERQLVREKESCA